MVLTPSMGNRKGQTMTKRPKSKKGNMKYKQIVRDNLRDNLCDNYLSHDNYRGNYRDS